MTIYTQTFPTPFGPFSLAVDATDAAVATAFGDLAALRRRLPECHVLSDNGRGAIARGQVRAFLAGERRDFDLRVAPQGTPFQHRVWDALRTIPFGETRTYTGLAAQIGHPRAARAVGRANATNPLCLIVPCHRVIGADGSLTGFAFGAEIKRRLLELEHAALVHAA